MSKSILVIDTPENCGKCSCSLETSTDCCGVNGRDVDFRNKPDWCPLKEVPQKYEPVSMNFEIGWNACIDEILKECD